MFFNELVPLDRWILMGPDLKVGNQQPFQSFKLKDWMYVRHFWAQNLNMVLLTWVSLTSIVSALTWISYMEPVWD